LWPGGFIGFGSPNDFDPRIGRQPGIQLIKRIENAPTTCWHQRTKRCTLPLLEPGKRPTLAACRTRGIELRIANPARQFSGF
jgi:hypothetical protein